MGYFERVETRPEHELYDDLHSAVGERTIQIVDRRRSTAVVKRRGWLVRRMLLGADVVGLVLAFVSAEWIAGASTRGVFHPAAESAIFVASLPGWIVVAKLYGLYDRDEERTHHSTTDELATVLNMLTMCTWLFWTATYLTHVARPTPGKIIVFWIAAAGYVTVARSTARAIARRKSTYLQNTVVVGAGRVGHLMARKLLSHPEYGLHLVGFVDAAPMECPPDLAHVAVLGTPDHLPAIIRLFDIERIVVAFSSESHQETLEVIRVLKGIDVQVDIVPRLFEAIGPNVGVSMMEGLPLLGLPPLRLSWSSSFLKRATDCALALTASLVLAPLLVIVALAVRLDTRGPVLYRHRRVGRDGRPIDVVKFRTMHIRACRGERYGGNAAELIFADLLSKPEHAAEFGHSYKLQDDPRVTRVGRLLRRTSLDELPQLLNVIRGDLSLVGPRAVTSDELHRYGRHVDDLLSIRPGVTGYWQVNGRSRLNYEDRVRLDLSYISSWSLGLDLTILARTLGVLARRGDAA